MLRIKVMEPTHRRQDMKHLLPMQSLLSMH